MRYPIITLSFLLLLGSCAPKPKTLDVIHFDSGFLLCRDTIRVDVKGEMTHALKYQDKLYLLFKQPILKYGGYSKRWLYVFSEGRLEQTADFTEEMNSNTYLDFYVKNDSIIVKPYHEKPGYYLDMQSYTWTKIGQTDDLIFEDDRFWVYSLDFGEWGGKTWFKDKRSGMEYEVEATNPLVNKIGEAYYLTNSYQVLEITDPMMLNLCDEDVRYENIRANDLYYSWYGESVGFDTVYYDTTYNPFRFEFTPYIVSSFVWQDELLHVYHTDTATYIATIDGGTVKPLQEIGRGWRFYNWYDSYRCRNLGGHNELLKFRTEDELVFGLLEMKGNLASVCYIVNNVELNPATM